MKLALNTLVYEVGNRGPEESLRSAAKFGFKYIEYAGIRKGNPATMTAEQKKEALRIVKDNGLVSSQMLLVATKDTAHPDRKRRDAVFEYMKKCADFQMELGGRQLLGLLGGRPLRTGSDTRAVVALHARECGTFCRVVPGQEPAGGF